MLQSTAKSTFGAAMLICGLAAPLANATIATHNLTGIVDYDGWDVLTNAALTTADLTSGFGSNEAGSGDAELVRLSGGHFPASASLYSFSTDSAFSVTDATAVAGIETIVFSIETWLSDTNEWSNALPTLNYNGGTQALTAGYSANKEGTAEIDFGGAPVDSYVYTYQWDVTGLGVTAFDVDWSQLVHTGVIALQLEQSDTFSVSAEVSAVPVPAAVWLFGSALVGLAGIGRRRH